MFQSFFACFLVYGYKKKLAKYFFIQIFFLNLCMSSSGGHGLKKCIYAVLVEQQMTFAYMV